MGEASELFITRSNVDQCLGKNKVTVREKCKNSILCAFQPSLKPGISDAG